MTREIKVRVNEFFAHPRHSPLRPLRYLRYAVPRLIAIILNESVRDREEAERPERVEKGMD